MFTLQVSREIHDELNDWKRYRPKRKRTYRLENGMEIPFIRESFYTMPSGEVGSILEMMSRPKANQKLAKSLKVGYASSGLSLAPSKESGVNLCPHATAGCIRLCVHHTGRAVTFERTVKGGRRRRAASFNQDAERFVFHVAREIDTKRRCVEKRGLKLCVRLNVFSDVKFHDMFPWLAEQLPSVEFYDYTKDSDTMYRFLKGEYASNVHYCFSRSENNWEHCKTVLEKGGTVAVVFGQSGQFRQGRHRFELPATWNGFPVVDGDINDLRFLDKPGSIVGLYAKGERSRTDKTGFVVWV